MSTDPLGRLFDPRSIVVVGASSNPDKWGYQYSRQLLAGADRRRVHLVSGRGGEILGQPTHPDLASLPEVPDVAVLCVPRDTVVETVEMGCRMGISNFVCITAGFGETDDEGARLQRRLAEVVREGGARLVGPNCVGLFDAAAALSCTAFWDLPPGPLAMVSQSGGLIVELADRLAECGLGFSRALSIGNQADVTIADAVDSYVADPHTCVIATYIEDFRDGRAVLGSFERAARAGKPVVALVPVGSAAVARAVSSHTASLVSDDAVVDMALAGCRAIRVRTVADLMLAVRALTSPTRMGHGRRVAVLADGGGGATLGTSAATSEGLDVERFSNGLTAKLAAVAPFGSGVGNPVDLVGVLDLAAFVPVLETIAASGEVDALVLTGILKNFNAVVDDEAEQDTARAITDLARRHGLGLAVSTNLPGEPAMRAFVDLGVCVADDPTLAARSLVFGAPRTVGDPVPAPVPGAAPVTRTDYLAARQLFADGGVAFPAALEVTDADSAVAAAATVGYPVVLKALGSLHKSDGGGVALRLGDPDAVRAALGRMQRDLGATGWSLEAMVAQPGTVELIVGVTRDARFGPLVTVGFGGTLTELLDDTVTALAPVTVDQAAELLARLRGARLLTGYRGSDPVDLPAAAEVVARVSEIVARHPELAEAELNPVAVSPAGAIALDARIVTAG